MNNKEFIIILLLLVSNWLSNNIMKTSNLGVLNKIQFEEDHILGNHVQPFCQATNT